MSANAGRKQNAPARDARIDKARVAPNPRAERAQEMGRHLDRLLRWAQLSLLNLARVILEIAGAWKPLDRATQEALAPQIKKLERFILALIMLKAGLRAKPPRKERRYGPRRSRHNARRLFGARLRKAVKARDLRAKIAALIALTHDPEAEIADAARRLAQGFTRRQGAAPRAAFIAAALCFAAAARDPVNSS